MLHEHAPTELVNVEQHLRLALSADDTGPQLASVAAAQLGVQVNPWRTRARGRGRAGGRKKSGRSSRGARSRWLVRTRAPFHSQPPHGVVLQLVLFAKPAKVTVAFWAAAEPASAAASRVTAVYCILERWAATKKRGSASQLAVVRQR